MNSDLNRQFIQPQTGCSLIVGSPPLETDILKNDDRKGKIPIMDFFWFLISGLFCVGIDWRFLNAIGAEYGYTYEFYKK
jgi:hypothetical protein